MNRRLKLSSTMLRGILWLIISKGNERDALEMSLITTSTFHYRVNMQSNNNTQIYGTHMQLSGNITTQFSPIISTNVTLFLYLQTIIYFNIIYYYYILYILLRIQSNRQFTIWKLKKQTIDLLSWGRSTFWEKLKISVYIFMLYI